MSAPALVVLAVSPFSERALWAFDHHRLPYQRIDHTPVLGERRLRKLLGKREGPATVPVLLDGATVLATSWDIVNHADRIGTSHKLLPAEHLAEIRRWNDLADRTMAHGRALVVANLLASPAALDESMPPGTPQLVRRLARPFNRLGTQWFARKYGVDITDLAPHEAAIREGLAALRAGLHGAQYILGSFTYADIIMTNLLQAVVPVADEFMPIGPATRRVWSHPALAREFADLVQWRDDIYRRHRSPA